MSQNEMVLEYMKQNGSITSYNAFKMGILRLSARIYELRNKQGYDIEGETVRYTAKDGKNKHYEVYRLKGGVK